jgi:hypothetical protein
MSRTTSIDSTPALSEQGRQRRLPRPRSLSVREQRQQRLQAPALRAMLAEMEQEAGPIPEEVMEQARRDLRRWSAD